MADVSSYTVEGKEGNLVTVESFPGLVETVYFGTTPPFTNANEDKSFWQIFDAQVTPAPINAVPTTSILRTLTENSTPQSVPTSIVNNVAVSPGSPAATSTPSPTIPGEAQDVSPNPSGTLSTPSKPTGLDSTKLMTTIEGNRVVQGSITVTLSSMATIHDGLAKSSANSVQPVNGTPIGGPQNNANTVTSIISGSSFRASNTFFSKPPTQTNSNSTPTTLSTPTNTPASYPQPSQTILSPTAKAAIAATTVSVFIILLLSFILYRYRRRPSQPSPRSLSTAELGTARYLGSELLTPEEKAELESRRREAELLAAIPVEVDGIGMRVELEARRMVEDARERAERKKQQEKVYEMY